MANREPTVRLEQRDSYLATFEARVVEVQDVEGRTWVALDRTAFYPESGGQPPDRGTLGEARVRDVQVWEGRVWHLLEGPPPGEGRAVAGAIDWERRFRHMQRHTGQHLLSQAFLKIGDAFATRSVGLGGPDCTLDLAGAPNEAALHQAEELVNGVAYRDLPIRAFEVHESELGAYPLRRPPKVRGTVRLVSMGDFEISACGGTHLRGTAQAVPIKLLKAESIRRNLTRVTFRAGLEALEDYREKHEVAHGLALSFSARIQEVPARVAAARSAERALAADLDAARARLAVALAHAWRDAGEDAGNVRIVTRALEPSDGPLIRAAADALAGIPRTAAVLGLASDDRALVILARSPDLALDVRPALQEALGPIEGRGGGRPEMAQGGGHRSDRLEVALRRARDALVAQL